MVRILLTILIWIGLSILNGLLLWIAWNLCMPSIFELPTISWLQATLLYVVSSILIGDLGFSTNSDE